MSWKNLGKKHIREATCSFFPLMLFDCRFEFRDSWIWSLIFSLPTSQRKGLFIEEVNRKASISPLHLESRLRNQNPGTCNGQWYCIFCKLKSMVLSFKIWGFWGLCRWLSWCAWEKLHRQNHVSLFLPVSHPGYLSFFSLLAKNRKLQK